MVGSLLDSGRSKASDILNRSISNGVEGEKSPKKFVDENSSLGVNSGEMKNPFKSGIQPRNFYSGNSRGSHLLCLATPLGPTDAEVVFGERQKPPRTYSRNQTSRLVSRPYPTATPFSASKKEVPRKVLGPLSNSFNAKSELKKPEETVSSSSSAVPNSFKFPSKVVASYEIGFPNQGLTCYLNSVLQALLGVPHFLNDLLKLQSKLKALPKDISSKLTSGLMGSFCRLANVKERGRQDDISEALHLLRAALVKSSPQFEGVHMQDAHEFLITFCDTFEKETTDFRKQIQDSVQQQVVSSGLENVSPIDTSFGFKLEETKQCQLCKHETSTITSDFVLKLASPIVLPGIKSKNPRLNNLKTLLSRTLDSKPEMHCEKCNSEGNAAHTFTERFVKLPKSLILYLPRTQYSTFEEKLTYSKNREAVQFPETLTLDEFCVENPNPPSEVENSPFKLDLTPAVKRRSSDSFSSDSPVKKNRPSFSSPITPPDSDKSVRNNNNSASTPEESPKLNSRPSNFSLRIAPFGSSLDDQSIVDFNNVALPSLNEVDDDPTAVSSPLHGKGRLVKFAVSPVLNGSNDFSPEFINGTPTPTKLKNLSLGDIEKLSDDDRLELAMRQSMKENNNVRRSLDLSLVGMSEEEQLAKAIEDSLRESREISPPLKSFFDKKGNLGLTLFGAMNGIGDDDEGVELLSPLSKASPPSGGARDCAVPSRASDESNMSITSDTPESDDRGTKDLSHLAETFSFWGSDDDLVAKQDSSGSDSKKKYAYKLIGVVSHLGGSAAVNSGHYVADVFSQKSNEWYRYDDLRVSQRKKSEVISENAKDAYLFIYQLQK